MSASGPSGPLVFNWESQAQFKNQNMLRVYVRRITRSTMYEKGPFFSRNWRKEN